MHYGNNVYRWSYSYRWRYFYRSNRYHDNDNNLHNVYNYGGANNNYNNVMVTDDIFEIRENRGLTTFFFVLYLKNSV